MLVVPAVLGAQTMADDGDVGTGTHVPVGETTGTGGILVVDDEREIRALLADMLAGEGCGVRTAADGAAALAILDTPDGFHPDVILLDMRMPVMDGWAFAAAYRRRQDHETPIVVMTAAQHALVWAAEVGAAACLPKPFELDELFAVLARFTDCVRP